MKNNIILVLFLAVFAKNSFGQEIKFGKVSKESLQEKFHKLDSTAPAAYLLNKRRTYYNYSSNNGFTLINEIHQRIKIYNKEGFDKATIQISLYRSGSSKEKVVSAKGYTFNFDNKEISKIKLRKEHRFNEKISDRYNLVKFVFPEVKEGSIIDLKYTVKSPYVSKVDQVDFQYDIPVDKLDVSIEFPEYFNFKKASKGYYNVPLKTTTKNGSIQLTEEYRDRIGIVRKGRTYNRDLKYNIDKFYGENIPALKDSEPFVTNISNYRGGIKYELSHVQFPNSTPKFYATTWEDVSKTIYKYQNFGGELNKSKYYKNDLSSVINTATGEFEKLGAIFQFVKSKVKWNGNYGKYTEYGVKKAYKEGVGNVADINLMLTSMLRSAGLNANPVLVSSRNNGIPLFPTLDGFNYIVCIVEFADGKYVLLDATEPYSMPNSLPVRALNWNGRKISGNGTSSWVTLNTTTHRTEENKVKINIDSDGTSSGILIRKETKLNAMLNRKRYNHLDENDLISKFEEKLSIEIDEFKSRNEKNIGKPLNRMLKFSSEDLVEEINGKLYISPLLFLTMKQNPFKSDVREFPIDFITPWKDENMISINVPEGYKIESVPEPLAIGIPDNLGVFKFKVINKGNSAQIRSVLQINSAIIAPTYYTYVKGFFKELVKKQNEKIIISKQ